MCLAQVHDEKRVEPAEAHLAAAEKLVHAAVGQRVEVTRNDQREVRLAHLLQDAVDLGHHQYSLDYLDVLRAGTAGWINPTALMDTVTQHHTCRISVNLVTNEMLRARKQISP